ncbi:MAG: aminotransferase class I/II-fold pyridoxal phosphate-dependent enzyme, partial [Minwuiales bacterium]|nr:aminotransferase class I/II-fold pyridoxal phosphate-dependent enzyme [Minwuiales bacterium]
DSAYAEYVDKPDYTDGLEFVAGTENVIVTRTFSKAYGLAALRIGWGYCSASMAGVINRMRAIGNVNAIAQAAVAGALEDQEFVRGVRDATNREREKLTDAFTAMGLAVTPSVTNFLIVRFPDTGNHRAGAAYAHLIRNGIIVREVTDYGLDDYLRFTIGRPEENDAVIEALSRFMV